MRKMKVGDFILIINKNAFTPQKRKDIHMYNKDYILGTKNSKSQSKISTNSNTGRATVQNIKSKPNNLSKFCLKDKKISLLNSRYHSSLKYSIIKSNELELLQKKVKILKAEEKKARTIQCKSAQQDKKKEIIEKEYEKKQTLKQKLQNLKKKEEREKQNKIKDIKCKEEYINIQRRKNNAKNFKKKRKEIKDMKRELQYHISVERFKRKEENKRKKEFIQKIDDDINKRKQQNEKHKNLLIIEQLEKKIKLQEKINGRLLEKIDELEKIGLGKIDNLNKIGKLMNAISQ
jgi:hypothetical protein